jgi:multiple antibiotic resistance protein
MEADLAATAFVTLFVIVDPVGLAPLFVALTRGAAPAERRRVALRSVAIAFGVLLLFGVAGQTLLDAVGIGMPAFRIAGGVLLFLTAVDMLFERRQPRREKSAARAEDLPDPTVFPLAVPLIAGPGALATMILLVGRHPGDLPAQLTVHAAMAAVLAITYLFFRAGGLIERGLGATGVNVVTRLLGMLLAALAVEFVLVGLSDYGFGPQT